MFLANRYFSLFFLMAMASAMPYSYFLVSMQSEDDAAVNNAHDDVSKTSDFVGSIGLLRNKEYLNNKLQKQEEYVNNDKSGYGEVLDILHQNDFDLNLKVLLGKDQQTIEITLQNTPNTNSPEFTKEEIYDQYMKDLFSENPVFGENDRDIKIFTASLKFMKHSKLNFKTTIESTGRITFEFYHAATADDNDEANNNTETADDNQPKVFHSDDIEHTFKLLAKAAAAAPKNIKYDSNNMFTFNSPRKFTIKEHSTTKIDYDQLFGEFDNEV